MSDLPMIDTTSLYVLYCFDKRGDRLPPEPVEAKDDVAAIALVRLQMHKRCELWQGDRLVLSVPEYHARA